MRPMQILFLVSFVLANIHVLHASEKIILSKQLPSGAILRIIRGKPTANGLYQDFFTRNTNNIQQIRAELVSAENAELTCIWSMYSSVNSEAAENDLATRTQAAIVLDAAVENRQLIAAVLLGGGDIVAYKKVLGGASLNGVSIESAAQLRPEWSSAALPRTIRPMDVRAKFSSNKDGLIELAIWYQSVGGDGPTRETLWTQKSGEWSFALSSSKDTRSPLPALPTTQAIPPTTKPAALGN